MSHRAFLAGSVCELLKASFDGQVLHHAGLEGRLIREPVAGLRLWSGRLSAFDPVEIFDTEPFDLHVPTGEFPVMIWIADFGGERRIAAASVEFVTFPRVDNWKLALVSERAGHLQMEYGVDAAIGCFCDANAADVLSRLGETEREHWRETLLPTADCEFPYRGSLAVPGTDDLNLAFFDTGWGPGLYSTYAGYQNSRLVCLMTDFKVLAATTAAHA